MPLFKKFRNKNDSLFRHCLCVFYSQFASFQIKCFGKFRFRDVWKRRNLGRISFVLNYSLIKIKFQLSLGSCHHRWPKLEI